MKFSDAIDLIDAIMKIAFSDYEMLEIKAVMIAEEKEKIEKGKKNIV